MRIAHSIFFFFVLLTSATAQTPQPSASGQDKFVGVWVFDTEKTKALNERTGVVIYVNYVVETITREGEYLHSSIKRGSIPHLPAERYSVPDKYSAEQQWAYQCDGKLYPMPYGSVSCRLTEQNVIEGSISADRSNEVMFGKKKPYYWKAEISGDGKEMKQYTYKNKDMTKIIRIDVFNRKQ
jgi:hypothetical protein